MSKRKQLGQEMTLVAFLGAVAVVAVGAHLLVWVFNVNLLLGTGATIALVWLANRPTAPVHHVQTLVINLRQVGDKLRLPPRSRRRPRTTRKTKTTR